MLVFTRARYGADRVVKHLDRDSITSAAIHGNKSQAARERALSNFRAGKIRVLVATDIAARGIDVSQISHVINYNLPNDPKSYLHRIGRTARAGCDGVAISFCDEDEKKPTQLEEEIKATQSGKYKIVHEFSDITETAYKSVLQDILDVYKKKQNISVLSNTEGSSSVKTSIILSGNYIIDKNMFSGIDKTKSELIKIVNPFTEKEKDTSELDDLSSEFLKVILCKKKFDANEYGKLCEKVIELHLASYKDLISLRLKAVKYYYEDKITECIATLKDALRIASKNTEVANWVLNDIAIDLLISFLSSFINDFILLFPSSAGIEKYVKKLISINEKAKVDKPMNKRAPK